MTLSLTHSPHGADSVGGTHTLTGCGMAVQLACRVDSYDWTCRGQLQVMVLRAVGAIVLQRGIGGDHESDRCFGLRVMC